jgi:hypothetical protein
MHPRLRSPQLECPFTLRNTCQPNIRNRGPLRETGCDHLLQNHPNPGLQNTFVDILRYGAFIRYTGPTQIILGENQPSALNDHASITKDIENRVSTSQILRLTTLPAKYKASPLGLARKQDCSGRRIHHLSLPSRNSVNKYVPHAWGTLTYRRFDDAIAAVQCCGPRAVLIKRDLADAFRHILVHPDDWWLLGLGWIERWWCDQFLPFVCRTSAFIFNLFPSAWEWILQTQWGWEHTLHYLDDFLAIFPRSATSHA